MPIKIDDVRSELRRNAEEYAREWAHGDSMISTADEQRKVQSWQERYRPAVVGEAAAELRAHKGVGARIGVQELADFVVAKAAEAWALFNQVRGPGKAFLSRQEADAAAETNPQFGMLTIRAWQAVRAAHQAEREMATYARFMDETFSTPIQSLEDWRNLTPRQRETLVDWIDLRQHPDLEYIPATRIDELTDPAAKAFAERMQSFMEDNGSMQVEDGHFPLVGSVTLTVQLMRLPSGEVMGGTIRFWQNGGYNDDGQWDSHYETEAEARADGVDPDEDVCWSASGFFDQDGTPFRYDDFMQWCGW